MVIVWGSGLYGKVDKVPGVGHVATNFGHLYYFPLIPTQSHFVISEDSSGYQSVPISMSLKSVLMAWFRSALVIGSIVLLITGSVEFSEGQQASGIFTGAVGLGCVGLFFATYYVHMFSQASYDRAMNLADEIGLNEYGRQAIEEYFGVAPKKKSVRRKARKSVYEPDDEYEDY